MPELDFVAEGNAERYAGTRSCQPEGVDTSQETLADGTLISKGGKAVKKTDKADPGLREPIWFE